jgi:serine/threonine protein phosphatase PrpC
MHYCSHELSLLYPPTTSTSSTPSAAAASYTPTILTPAAVLAPLPASVTDVDPVDILQRAYERTLDICRADGSLGSSTALVAVLLSPSPSSPTASGSPAHPRLRIAHIGDCLIGVIRQNELIYRSSEQQHRFNYPYQLGPQSQTTPQRDAIRIDLPVQEGDVIVLATDGLGDNLWDEDVLEEAIKFGQDVRGMSEALAKRAKKVSESGTQGGETPFARRAQEENKTHVGGKVDGMCVFHVL